MKRRQANCKRTYHVIDLENYLGGTLWDDEAVAALGRDYHDLVHVGPQDQVVVAVDAAHAYPAHDAFPGAKLIVARGKDAADYKLIYAERPEWLAQRFNRVVVASGDHIFAGFLCDLRLKNVETVLVARAHSASRASCAEASSVLTLPEPVVLSPVLDLVDDRSTRTLALAQLH